MTGIKPLTLGRRSSPDFPRGGARRRIRLERARPVVDAASAADDAAHRRQGIEQDRSSSAAQAIEAVRDVSFGVRHGEFVALLGPSGSGKSTVLNMIATLIKPTGGEILIDGTPVIAGKATPDVGYVFQRDTLFPWRTVADNIGYGLQLAGVAEAERKERVAACVAQAGLQGFERRLSVRAVGRHAPARGADADAGGRAANPADGRTVRRARHPHQDRHA